MSDTRQKLAELADEYSEGSPIRELCLKASEEIRILENEVSDLRSFAKLARDNAKADLGQ